MKRAVYLFLFLLFMTGCQSETEIPQRDFNKLQWSEKKGKDYLHRPAMLEAVVYNDTIRTLEKEALVALLGTPDYERESHLYYRISESRIGFLTLKTQTIVIKISDTNTVEWIKIHGN